MKTLIYKKNGNELTFKNLELIKDKENIYHTYIDEDYCLFIGEIKGVYFEIPQYCNYRYYLHPESYKEHYDAIISKIKDFLNDFENFVKNQDYPNLIFVKVFELIGIDNVELLQKRESYLQKREKKRKEDEILKLEQKRKKELDHLEWCEKTFESFKNGSDINFNSLLELIKFKKLDVHIRTLGAISKMGNNTISLKSGVFSKKTSQSTVNSIFQVTENLMKCEEKKTIPLKNGNL